MTAETARQFEALERQAQTLMEVFVKAGHEAVAPAMIQPADIFLDRIGEELRARTYVFTDPEGHELCLRPDLTVPTCRLHLARAPDWSKYSLYCYNGPAFRFQPQGADAAHPREFRQAGIERFGEIDREGAEVETLRLILAALDVAGMQRTTLKIGDLGLFRALLSAIDMPQRWRDSLTHHFWRRGAFRTELKRLATDPASTATRVHADLLGELNGARKEDAEDIVARRLDTLGAEIIGARTLSEITASLLAQAEDACAKPLPAKAAGLIESYVGIVAPVREAFRHLDKLVTAAKVDMKAPLASFDHRLVRIANAGVDLDKATFAAEFGRNLAYYTGFVFEVLAPGGDPKSPIAGGGRYDSLLKAVGAPRDVPAIGAAIHTERLLAVANGSGNGGAP